MTTTVQAVEKHLETDPILHGALDRGILNVRQAARWLIRANEWDTTEEAVVSALRRYEAPASYELETAMELLSHSDFTARTGLAAIILPRRTESLAKIPPLSRAFNPEDTLTVLPERKQILLVIEEVEVQKALKVLGKYPEPEVRTGIAKIELELAEESETAATAVSIVLNVLQYHSLDLVSIFGTIPTCSILIDRDQFVEANSIISQLTTKDAAASPS